MIKKDSVKPWDELYIKVCDKRLRLLLADGGYERWLVMWPGLGATAEQFTSLLKHGPKMGINVISLDPPGHGFSEPWDKDFTLSSVKEILAGIFTHFKIRSSIIGGHSYGAYIAAWCSSDLKSVIEGLVLLDGGYLDPFPNIELDQVKEQNKEYLSSRKFNSWEEFIQEEKQSAHYWDEDIKYMLCTTMKKESGKIIPRISLETANQVSSLLFNYSVSRLKKIQKPVLLLYPSLPEEYQSTRTEGVSKFNEQVENLQDFVVPNSSHDVLVDNPVYVNEKVWEFIKRLSL